MPLLLVGTAFQSRALVLIGLLFVVGIVVHGTGAGTRGAAQARPVGIVLVIDLAAIVQHRQPGLDVIKFGSVDDVFRLRQQDLLDFVLRCLDAFVGHGVS